MITSWFFVTVVALGIMVITIAERGSFFFLPARVRLPKVVEEALRYAPACALAAIVAPTVFANPDKTTNLDVSNPRLWAVLVAGTLFYFKRSMALMMVVGMITFTLLRKLL